MHCHHTPTQRLPLLFHLKPSHSSSVLGFGPNPSPPRVFAPEIEPRRLGFGFLAQTPSPGSHLPTQRPTTTITSSAPPHHLPLLLSILIFDCVPEIKPQWLGFGFLALN
ncbi:hypothetical protein PILCRDRAFT_13732 [Piloderma croceum F 1598]|uniref:Uncharacterized protein n=1 Tax=Piloderma croceum (strain F 1598) TaxID=765440 RepID=A0A0C3BDF3_PILCF|nr:hypothetical protein PILCRDRAFT_13732 [Piloderma croceum F 1598]